MITGKECWIRKQSKEAKEAFILNEKNKAFSEDLTLAFQQQSRTLME